MKIGYARVSTARHYFTAQLDALKTLGVDEKYTYFDLGVSAYDPPGPTGKPLLTRPR